MHDLRKHASKVPFADYLLKIARRRVCLPRFESRYSALRKINRRLTRAQLEFLHSYWYSISAVELAGSSTVLYHVMLRTSDPGHFYPKPGQFYFQLFSEAKRRGFITKLAVIELSDNWNFSVQLHDFFAP